jgi:hypothetical protein
MPADQARAEVEEVPLRARGLEHLVGVDAHLVEDDRELVHEGDVEVALRVLDHLGGLGHADRGRLVHARRHHRGVEVGDLVERLGVVARDHLEDLGEAVLLVARLMRSGE